MVPTQEQATDKLSPEDEQDRQDKWEERRIKREGKRWAIVVSVITALTGLAIAVARVIEALAASGGC